MMIFLLLGGTVVFFYPKERIIGGLRGGPIGPDETAYGEEYSCFGFSYDFTPPWPDYGGRFLCYGMRYNRQCFVDTEKGGIVGVVKVGVGCR
ncbi:MAG: hypothetical protein G01um101433_538 [Parcubacteria group bacterium Gr01-1014_33]|nr:MAG: hypothetical protein G01um101433_538 [Parcubacteria group bacterium Gr01-1014_33]